MAEAKNTSAAPEETPMNRIGRRIVMCMILIAALAVIWNLLGQ
jgi:hypothetical protein